MRRRGRAISSLGGFAVGFLSAMMLFLASASFIAGLFYANLVKDLPPVGNIEIQFGRTPDGFPEPIRVYDGTGGKLLFLLLNPAATDRQWSSLASNAANPAPESLIQATIAFHDPNFWKNNGYDQQAFAESLISILGRGEGQGLPKTITQQLVEMTLLPAQDWTRSPVPRFIRSAVLAERLTKRYPKEQILEWYLNSANYGNLTYGIDAAALAYFGKHARDLSLAESAMLAALPFEPESDPIHAPQQAKIRQEQVLSMMLAGSWITPSEGEAALSEAISSNATTQVGGFPLQRYTWERLVSAYGLGLANRYGLSVITSLDADLQRELECAVQLLQQTSLENGSQASGTFDSGVDCRIAALLPAEWVSDRNPNRRGDAIAVVILDPHDGRILGLYGAVDQPAYMQAMAYPFVYLTAFTRGYSPGTMILDLPILAAQGSADAAPQISEDLHGPVRIRTALQGAYPHAAQRMFQTIGSDTILQVMIQMGVRSLEKSGHDAGSALAPEDLQASLLELSFAYGVLANEGKMVGASILGAHAGIGQHGMVPILITRIEDQHGVTLAQVESESKAILTSPLAFLITDVLSDPQRGALLSGRLNLTELNRPAGVVADSAIGQGSQWAIGFTPSRVVGVRMDAGPEEGMAGMDRIHGAPLLWRTLMEYVFQEIPPEGWEKPEGIREVEVCDPSGLLPTRTCPLVVREYFLEGTEPVQYDNLYQPVLVNRETGKLATLHTPLEWLEERIFLSPPPEASYWSESFGWAYPPQEYEMFEVQPAAAGAVSIEAPLDFELIGGKKWIRGSADMDGLQYYRLIYGEGFNPRSWYQIGEDQTDPVAEDRLALWDTSALQGLYSLELMVVDEQGRVHRAIRFVTIDNQPPQVEILHPKEDGRNKGEVEDPIRFEVRASDGFGLAKVEFWVDGSRVGVAYHEPYLIEIFALPAGPHLFLARAYDLAGNMGESVPIRVEVGR